MSPALFIFFRKIHGAKLLPCLLALLAECLLLTLLLFIPQLTACVALKLQQQQLLFLKG